MLGAGLVEGLPDAGSSGSISARRWAAMKSRLSIMAAVIVRRFVIEPVRGRQAEPVADSN